MRTLLQCCGRKAKTVLLISLLASVFNLVTCCTFSVNVNAFNSGLSCVEVEGPCKSRCWRDFNKYGLKTFFKHKADVCCKITSALNGVKCVSHTGIELESY